MKFNMQTKLVGLCLLVMGLGLQSAFSEMEGSVEVTAQGVRRAQNSSKLNEYRTVPDGAFVEDVTLKSSNDSTN